MKGGGRGKNRQHAHFLQRQRDISLLVLSPTLFYKMLSPQSSVRFYEILPLWHPLGVLCQL